MTRKQQLKLVWSIVILACLVLGFRTHDLVRLGFFLSGTSLAAYGIGSKSKISESIDSVLFHLFSGLVIVDASFAIVWLWKFVSHQVVYTFPHTWSEQVIFLSSVQTQGISGLYAMANLQHPPFLVSIYTPGYYLVEKTLLHLFGPSILLGRSVSVAAVAIIAVLLGLASKRIDTMTSPLTAPLLFLSNFPLLGWSGTLAKADLMAAALSFAGFLVYFTQGLESGKRWILPSSVLCGLALLTKQSAVGGSGAIIVHLLWRRSYRQCGLFVLLTLCCFLLPSVALGIATGGGYWFMTTKAVAAFTLRKIIAYGFTTYLTNVTVAIGLGVCAIPLLWEDGRLWKRTAVAGYFLIALFWGIFSLGRPGSSPNYLIEALVSGALLLAFFVSESEARHNQTVFRLVLVAVGVAIIGQIHSQIELTAERFDDNGDHARILTLLSELKTRPDEYVLSDAYYTFDVVQTGHRPLVMDSLQYTLMVDSGALSVDRLMQQLRDKKVPYAVLENSLKWHASLRYGDRYLPTEVVDYLSRNYSCRVMMRIKSFAERYLIICARTT